jgi:hypothetical protein
MRRVLTSGGVWVGAIVLALVVGCGESARPPAFTSPGGSGGGGSPATAGSAGQLVVVAQPSFLDSCAGMAPGSPLTRWSILDLDQSLDAWFGPGEKLASVAPPDFEYYRDVSRWFVDALLHVTQQRVKAVVADDAVFEICATDAADEPSCAQAFLREWGGRLYRQPLTNEQLEAYVAQFRSAASASTSAEAARNALVSMVLSPYVVLRLELGDSKVAGRPAPHELAARLSHFGARRAPDAQLLASAAAGALLSPDERKAELHRLWSSPEGQRGRVSTHLEWLGIRPDNERSDLDPELRADMATQVGMLVDDLLQSPSPTLQSLLTWSREPLNPRLATHYGVRPLEGDGFLRVDLDPTLFAGVLSTGAFLTRYQRPTARGLQVLDALLCTDVPPPPPDITGPLPEGGTPRARITAAVGQSPSCVACHQVMDPVGFALEAFDDQGRITNFDSSGSLPALAGVAMSAVANPGELGSVIALSDKGRACAARRYLEFALDRKLVGTATALGIRNPEPPNGAAPIPIQSDPDQRWIDCLLQVSNPPSSFDFTQVGEALVASNLLLTRNGPSQRVVAFDTSVDPVEHAALETRQFRGVFSAPEDEAMIQRYEEALFAQLAEQARGDVTANGGEGGVGGDSSGGASGPDLGGAP